MALLHFDSFNGYLQTTDMTSEYAVAGADSFVFDDTGLGGRRVVSLSNYDYVFSWDQDNLTDVGTGVELYAAFDIKLEAGDNSGMASRAMISLGSAETGIDQGSRGYDAYLYIEPDSSMTDFIVWAMVDGTDTNIGTMSVPDENPHRMEIRLKPSSANGAGDGEARILLDGVEIFTYSGDISGVGGPCSRVMFGGVGARSSVGTVNVGAFVVWNSDSPGFSTFPMGPVVIDQIDPQNADLVSDDGDTSTVTLPATIPFEDGSASANAIGARGFLRARTAGGQSNRAVNLELNASSESVSGTAVVLVSANYGSLFTPVLEATSSDLLDTSIVVSDL